MCLLVFHGQSTVSGLLEPNSMENRFCVKGDAKEITEKTNEEIKEYVRTDRNTKCCITSFGPSHWTCLTFRDPIKSLSSTLHTPGFIGTHTRPQQGVSSGDYLYVLQMLDIRDKGNRKWSSSPYWDVKLKVTDLYKEFQHLFLIYSFVYLQICECDFRD